MGGRDLAESQFKSFHDIRSHENVLPLKRQKANDNLVRPVTTQ